MRRYPNLPDDATTQAGRDYLSVHAHAELRRAQRGLMEARHLFIIERITFKKYVDLLEKFQAAIDHWETMIARLDGSGT